MWASAQTDIPGRIAFGPYDDSYKKGFYRAKFRLKVDKNLDEKKVALIDVYSNTKDFKPVHRIISPKQFYRPNVFQDFEIDFYKPNDSGHIEFRVYFYGVGDLYFDRVDVFRLTKSL